MLLPITIAANLMLAIAAEYVIIDPIKDIEELDVGDLDDMEVDVSPMFLERIRNNDVISEPQMVISLLRWDWAINAKLRGTESLGYTWMVG